MNDESDARLSSLLNSHQSASGSERRQESKRQDQTAFSRMQAQRELEVIGWRAKHFPQVAQERPVWRIMLDLYVNDVLGRGETVTNLCIASGEPQTTALRWIAVAEEAGILMKLCDAKDRRRRLLVLTNEAKAKLDHFFESRPHKLY